MAKAATKPKAKAKPKAEASVKVSNIADMVVNQTEMAAILRISTRFLRELTTSGSLEKDGSGYHIANTVRSYADWLKTGSVKKSGTDSMDALRAEKMLEIRMNRARKERDLIPIDESIAAHQELIGMFTSYLSGLPAEITGVPKERQRVKEIIDAGKQRLADRLAERLKAVRVGDQAADAEADD